MSLRDSLDLIRMVRPEAGTAALESEIMAERASSLGFAERRVAQTIAALNDATTDREACLAAARSAVCAYFVQRELIGFRQHSDVIQEFSITREVLVGLGAMPRQRK